MAGEKLVRRALQAVREVAKPLPMDEASRLARAQSQGFTIDAFKGAYPYDPATGPVYGFKGGRWQPVERIGEEEQLLTHFDTPDKPYAGFFGGEEVANRFAKAYGEKGSVFPVKLKFENPVEIDAAGRPAAAFQFEPIAREHGSVDDYLRFRSAFDEASKYDGVIIKNTADEGTIYIPRTPQQIRSRFAEFDPERITSKDLLAGGAGVGAVGATMEAGDMAQQGAEEPREGFAGGGIISRALKAARETLSPEELLMGIHNTRSGRGLEMVEKLGGLPAPSIAVTKPSQGYTSFGDISLVAPVEMVTPGRKTPAFASDVSSPRFPHVEDDQIFRGFTPSGKRRYAPVTMDNVLREMKGPIRGGEGYKHGVGSIRAQVTPQFKSLAEMQAAREKIIPASEFEAQKEISNEMLERLRERFEPYFKSNDPYRRSWSAFPDVMTDYARTRNPSEFAYDYKDLPAEALTEARSFLSHLRNMPTEYFEVKPQRGVPLSEFAGAVVPGDVPGEVVDRLRRLGIGRIEEYGDDASRRDALMKFVGEQGFAEGGEVRDGYDKGGSIARRAVDAARRIMGYTDPPTKKIEDWKWRPLSEVDKELGLREIPPHVQQFGDYMREMVDKGRRGEISDRDLIKAYTTTRASIQRRAADTDAVREASGLPLFGADKKIRPEGAWSEWLMSPAGQKYLDRAVKGELSGDTVESALSVMRKFGLAPTQIEAMDWAAKNLPGRSKAASDLVYRAGQMDSPVSEWRDFTSDVRGIGPAKSGFVASLLGRGDLPTLDARQVILNTGLPTEASERAMARSYRGQKSFGAQEGVDRLAARQEALGLEAPSKYDPFYQHLAHHAIWDKASNETTTHADVINAMRNAGIVLGIPAAGAAVMPEDQPVERASGGRLLQDEYPTQHLPNVGRQVMADGGSPSADDAYLDALLEASRPDADIRRYESRMADIARQPEDIRSMTHAPSKPLRPVEIEGGLIGKRTLGEVPYDVAGPLSSTAQLGYTLKTLPFYFTPAAPLAAAADFGEAAIDTAEAAKKGDYLGAGVTGALGVAMPGYAYRKQVGDVVGRALNAVRGNPGAVGAGVAGAAMVAPEDAEAVVPVSVAKRLLTRVSLPRNAAFEAAVGSTPSARIEDGRLLLSLIRGQQPGQAGQPSTRGGVFYLPEGSRDARHYKGGAGNFYGGPSPIMGESAFSNPLFVKGATGGKAPEAAYDELMGKKAYQAMRNEALSSTPPYYLKEPELREEMIGRFLEKYAPSMVGQEQNILRNSNRGNQLAYALQESAVGDAVRRAGYDSVLGYSTSRSTKQPFISEVFDVRERSYPTSSGGYDIWPEYLSPEDRAVGLARELALSPRKAEVP